MKILLIGKTGQLGGDLLRRASSHEIVAPGREELDVTNPEEIEAAVGGHRPDVVINTSAFHDVPLCETEWAQAFRVNCIAVRDLANACRIAGSMFVTFSSDYVFGGEKRTPYIEDDRPSPLQVYGITRLAGEQAALSAAPGQSIVIRTCGLYGMDGARSKGGNFVEKRLADAKERAPIEMGCDQTVSPTWTGDLSEAVLKLIAHPGAHPGIYHLVGEGECTWYEFTRAIYELSGIDAVVRPVDRGGRTGAMRRPLYSALANTKARMLGIHLPPWRNGLESYVKKRSGA